MPLLAALIYWAIIAVWLTVLGAIFAFGLRDRRGFRAAKLLLAALIIDAVRNIIENAYFGRYFGAQYGLFSRAFVDVLGNPNLLILPKLANIFAAVLVLILLLRKWLPASLKERRSTQDGLRQAELRFRLLVDSVKEYAIYLLDTDGRVTSWNAGAERITGYMADEVIGTSVTRFYPEEERAAGASEQALQIARDEGRFEREGWRVRKDGTKFWANVVVHPVLDEAGRLVGFAKVTQDITERKLAEQRLTQLAHYDQLTGLPNRATLNDDLRQIVANCAGLQSNTTTAIVLFDLDGFKEINDTLGHSVGDMLLQQVAQRLLTLTRGAAGVYRLGGDEFVLIFRDCGGPLPLVPAVESILTRLAEGFDVSGHRLFIAASAGIATAPHDASSAEELVSSADLALYDAKAAGGRTYRLFFPILRANAQARRDLKTEVRRAFAEKELVLYFQPQLRLTDGLVMGAEALLRWRHPERGILGPAAFIEALAQSPIVLDVGKWILQTACQSAARWRAIGLPPIRVGVNLFPAQFQGGSLLGDVETALAQSGLCGGALELEITENIALGEDDHVLAQLQALSQRGVDLAFDDFGTGYASLSYLARYPLTRIKIDQSFVRKITEKSTPNESALLRATIVMAHSLGLKVIAEGVETSVQEEFLKAERCEEVQGFFYAKPLPADEFEEFVRRNCTLVKSQGAVRIEAVA